MSYAHRCGTVAIVGRPNVGKSTLLNRFLGQKIAIVSRKPETTRDRLLGILTLPEAQILFLDTPGIYRGAKTLMAKHQVQAARQALAEADVILLLTEGPAGLTDQDRQIIQILPKKKGVPCFLAINKVDRIERKLLLPQIAQAQQLYPFLEIFPISAAKGDNVERLLQALAAALPEGEALYPADEITDRPLRFQAQELVREKVLVFTHEEVPHSVAVLVEEWRAGEPSSRTTEQKPSTYIRATIYVERESQKGILIGKEGGLLKKIGQEARKEIEDLTESPVYLDLWVKVAHHWRKDPQILKILGYDG